MGDDLVRVPNAPAVVERRPVPPRAKTDDWALVIQPIANLAEQVAGTDFVPAALRGKPAAVTAAILFGRELDMPPMQALQQVHVIEGRPSLSAEHLRAMVLAAGHSLRVTGDGGQATAVGRRLLRDGTYDEPVTVTWTISMAQVAGLTGKKNWQKHPRQMLKARATAELCRDLFPDITHGLEATEALQDDDEAGPVLGSPAQDTKRVSRAKKGADSGKATGPAPLPPVAGPAPAAAPPATASQPPAGPPLPGEEAPAEFTPGEGTENSSTPAGASTERRQCPVISNGQQCRYYADHTGQHTYGGGIGDPVQPRRCAIPEEHVSHAWNPEKDVWYACSGDGDLTPDGGLLSPPEELDEHNQEHIPDAILCGPNEPGPEDLAAVAQFQEELAAGKYSEGDGSPDDVAATATDETWAAAQEAAGGPVAENDPPLSKGAQRALFAAFGSLGVKDDQERYHTTSALLGLRVTSWNDLTRSQGERLFKAVEKLKTRDELEELVQRAAEAWGANDAP